MHGLPTIREDNKNKNAVRREVTQKPSPPTVLQCSAMQLHPADLTTTQVDSSSRHSHTVRTRRSTHRIPLHTRHLHIHTRFTFLKLLRSPAHLLMRPIILLPARNVSDVLRANCAVIARMCREERIVAVPWIGWRFPMREERCWKATEFLADSVSLFQSSIGPKRGANR